MAQTRSTPYVLAEVREIVALKSSISPWPKGRAAASSRGAAHCPSSTRRCCCAPTAVPSPADHHRVAADWHQCRRALCSSTPPDGRSRLRVRASGRPWALLVVGAGAPRAFGYRSPSDSARGARQRPPVPGQLPGPTAPAQLLVAERIAPHLGGE